MQLNLMEIAQKLIDELLAEEQKNRHRAEGVAMLFQRIQEAHSATQQEQQAAAASEESNVEG